MQTSNSAAGRKTSSSSSAQQYPPHENIICRLCFEFEAEKSGDYFVVAKCGHLYHNFCIKEYLERGKFVCPTCSRPMHSKKLTKLYGIDPSPVPGPGSSGGTKDCSSSTLSSQTPNAHHDYSFKLVLLGSAGTGKSCLLKRFYDNSFDTRITYTGGTDLVRKTVHIGDEVVQLIIWDTIGQEKFKSVISTCVREAHGIIFVYDVGRRESFDGLEFWWNFALDHAPKEAMKILVGNKIDLEESRAVTEAEGEALGRSLDIPFFETSAKEDHNVEDVFRTLTGQILQNDWIMSAISEKMKEQSLSSPPFKLHSKLLEEDGEEGSENPNDCFNWLRRGVVETLERIQRAFS